MALPSRDRVRKRVRQLARKLNSPVWVMLGATKTVESAIASPSDVRPFAIYTAAVALVWVVGVVVWETVEETVDEATGED